MSTTTTANRNSLIDNATNATITTNTTNTTDATDTINTINATNATDTTTMPNTAKLMMNDGENNETLSTERFNLEELGDELPLSVVLATAGYDHTIRFWDVVTGACASTLQHAESQVNCLALTRNKRFLAVAGNPCIRIYDTTKSAAPLVVFEGHDGNVTSVGFSMDGRWMYSSGEDGLIRIWDMRTAKCQHEFGATSRNSIQQPFSSHAFSSQFAKKHPSINSVVLHPNQLELISVDQYGSMKLWELGSYLCTTELIPEENVPLRSVNLSNNGTQIATANNNGRVYIWQSSRSNESLPGGIIPIAKIQAHSTYITKCTYSPDSNYLATTSADGSIKLWSIATTLQQTDPTTPPIGEVTLVNTMNGHLKWVWDCAWSADSAYLVSASSDNSARLWEVSTGETVSMFTGHNKALTSVALNDLPL